MEEGEQEQGRLVESGSFRLSAAKALEKLSRFQLADPESFLLPLLRCAVASGCRRIAADTQSDGLRLSFDGRPFTREAMRDPWAALLGEGRSERQRHLGAGLLAAMRLEPAEILLVSGAGAGRQGFRLSSEGPGQSLEPPPPGEETMLTFRWAGGGGWAAGPALARLGAGFGLSRVTLLIHGLEVPLRPGGIPFKDKEVEGRLFPEPDRWGPSVVRLYHLGALVETVELPPDALPLEAWLTYPRLRLNLSQSGALRDAAYRNAMAALERQIAKRRKLFPRRTGDGSVDGFSRDRVDLLVSGLAVTSPMLWLVYAAFRAGDAYLGEAGTFLLGEAPAWNRWTAGCMAAVALSLAYFRLTGRLRPWLRPLRYYQCAILLIAAVILAGRHGSAFTAIDPHGRDISVDYPWPGKPLRLSFDKVESIYVERAPDGLAWRLNLREKGRLFRSVWCSNEELLLNAANAAARTSGRALQLPEEP